MWRLEDSLWDLVFSVYHMGLRGQTQVVRLGCTHSYLLAPDMILFFSKEKEHNCHLFYSLVTEVD